MSVVRPYRGTIVLLLLFALLSNALNLLLPRIIAYSIDTYAKNQLHVPRVIIWFAASALFIFVFAYVQSILQTYASEKVARVLRSQLANNISGQSYAYIQQSNPARLLTNLTSDIDSVKMYVSQAIVSIASSIFIIIGASVLLITIEWKLALVVLTVIPMIAVAFFTVLRKVRSLFKKGREVIDMLNKVISESILGAALIRVLNSQHFEYVRFLEANTRGRDLGLSILRLFSTLIPIITFFANLAVLSVLAVGGHFVIAGKMTLGDFAAFNSYISILIFPIFVIGFMSNIIAQANASWARISQVLHAPEPVDKGTVQRKLNGDIVLHDVSLSLGGKPVLKNISFSVPAGSRTAILGPTAAGKTQLLNMMIGLQQPHAGTISYDDVPIVEYNKGVLLKQIGLVFQDSIIFNMSLRENIAFNEAVSTESLQRAIDTAELHDFIDTLAAGLDTVISERGTSLSGGQKQRIMLARALAISPAILLLDDFTARVDTGTEQKILRHVQDNYPQLTLVSVTQKIASVEQFDQIILIMDGELIAKGTHGQLMETCPEYVQIYNSQRSTSNYELQS